MESGAKLEVVNNIKIRSILFFLSITLIGFTYSFGIFIIPSAIIWIIAYSVMNREISHLKKNATEFARNYPFKYFGSSYGSFSHAFYYEYDLKDKLLNAIQRELALKTTVGQINAINITDVDRSLNGPDDRRFYVTVPTITRRGTSITLLISFRSFGRMQYIQWWVLAGGYIDSNKKFNFVAYSPITIWLWIIPYLRRNYDITALVRTIHSSTYNVFDSETRVKCLHEVVFEALISELENHGIDTSSLKEQKMQAISINMSGGNFNMGDIIQSAKTKISGTGKVDVK